MAMKHSHSIGLHVVPEWHHHNTAYGCLHKTIQLLEGVPPNASSEWGMPVHHEFMVALDEQVAAVTAFYNAKERELSSLVAGLKEHTRFALEGTGVSVVFESASAQHQPKQHPFSLTHLLQKNTDSAYHAHSKMGQDDHRRQVLSTYTALCELASFLQWSHGALDKVLTAYDQVLGYPLRNSYLANLETHNRSLHPETLDNLRRQIELIESTYAAEFCHGDVGQAARHMKTQLEEKMSFERNTAWAEPVGQTRKTFDVHTSSPDTAASAHRWTMTVPRTTVQISVSTQIAYRGLCFALSFISFLALLHTQLFEFDHENACFALLVCVSLLWATEAIPLYATSFMIPLMIVALGILQSPDGTTMSAKAASKQVFGSMFSGAVSMLLGGFSMAAALSKYGMAKAFATHVMAQTGNQPSEVLFAIMLVASFLSMWISNVATPTLCFSLINPILRTLPDRSPVAVCLILGIALASCIGGMVSPIASPQNIVTLQYLDPLPGWATWFAITLPIALASLLFCWSLLVFIYQPNRAVPQLRPMTSNSEALTHTQMFILGVSALTVLLWCAESRLEDYLGDMGIIATIPLFAFFGTGILTKEDLHGFMWSVVILAQGGMALGHAVTSSGLLSAIALSIKANVQHLDAMVIMSIFASLILFVSTFVSHTVAALILLPIVQQVGLELPIPRTNLLVMGAGLACSAGMGLPVSGYPNMSAAMLESSAGRTYLSTRHFILIGIPTSVICTLLICTVGYAVMTLLGY